LFVDHIETGAVSQVDGFGKKGELAKGRVIERDLVVVPGLHVQEIGPLAISVRWRYLKITRAAPVAVAAG
jgi:hypothetical protein